MIVSSDGDIVTEAMDLYGERRFADALTLLKPLIDTDLASPELLGIYASCLRNCGQPQAALDIYGRLEASSSELADFWFNRSNALADLERYEEADASLAKALEIEPSNAKILANRGISRTRLRDEEGAIACYRKALMADPDHRLAAHNLANLLMENGEVEEATALYRSVLRHSPDLAEAHYNLGRLLLLRGDYAQGSEEYEWRWRVPAFLDRPVYADVPPWNGRPFPGKCLVVYAEQGLGDTIQFSKLLGLVKSLGGDVVLHVPERLSTLMQTLPFEVEVVHRKRASGVDLQAPLMSLIHLLKLTPGSIPALPAHLGAEASKTAFWADRLALMPGEKTIGLVWQGNPLSPVERGRSLGSAEPLAPLCRLDGVRLLALQKLEPEALEAAPVRSGWRVRGLSFDLEHPGPDFDGGGDAFLDTAAIMARLDLVVSVCTAPLHLAGALGRPAVGLLKSLPDWRWARETDKTPWYPTMQLERQRSGEDFGPAIARAATRAAAMLSRGR